jgi:7-cyano-7-deazaguanine synthase
VKHAVVLLSGGLDSTTVLAIAKRDFFECHCISFRYGQRHAVELEHAEKVARALGAASWQVAEIDLRAFGGSALTSSMEVPKDRDVQHAHDIPVTYVPARNTVFLSFALALAEVKGAHDIFFGANAIDYSGYPDCRPEFVSAFEHLANVATKMGVEGERITIHAPLIKMTKAEIIRTGSALGVDYSLTWSCYAPQDGGQSACGRCDSCLLRKKGFVDAGVPDPTPYAA